MLEITLTCPECGTPNSVPVSEGAALFTCASCGAESPISETLDALTRVGEDPLIGAVISECEIVEKVGEGGFGAVYKAIDRNLQRPVALKIMLQSLTSNQEFVQKFIREAITAAALNHPHIVAVHKVGRDEDRGIHYLIMEFLEGQTLADVIDQKGPIPIEESVAIIQQASDALATAHEKSIIHRDIKPENIMIDARGNVKITDFGLAKVVNPDMRSTKVVGTPHYMSPEQFEGKAVDGRTDIYSLGVTFYYMLTKAKPYEGTNTVQVIYSILTHDPRPPMEVNPGVSEELWTIIRRMIEKDPEERYQGFREVQRDLEGFGEKTLRAMVACSKCEAENPQGRRYCRECGALLITACQKCGSEEPAGVRHCGQCGSNLALAVSVRETADRASRARSRGELRQALRLYEEILSIEPENLEAEEATRELQAALEKIDGLRAEAEQMVSRGDLEGALGHIEGAMTDIPSAAELETLRTEIRTKVTGKAVAAHRLVAEKALESHDYEAAAAAYRRAHELDLDDPELEYELRQAEKKASDLADYVTQARDHFEAQQYDLAFPAAKQALALSPDHEVARDIHDRARGFLESVDSLLDQGREATAEARYEDARNAFEGALEVRPDDDRARELLDGVREKLAAFDERLAQARARIDSGAHAEAVPLIEALEDERPFDDRIGPLREACRNLVQQEDRDRRVLDEVAAGRDAEKRGRLNEAAAHYEKALDADVDSEKAKNLLEKVRQKIEDAEGFERLADEHEREGNLAQALAALNRLLTLRPGDEKIDTRLRELQRRKNALESKLQAAEAALEDRRLEEADDLGEQALRLSPRSRRAEKVRSEVLRLRTSGDKHVAEARNRIAGELFDDALTSLRRAEECGYRGPEIEELRSEAEHGRIAVLKSNATRSFRFEDFEGAVKAYEEVLAVSSTDPEALAGRKEALKKQRASRRESPVLKMAASVLLLLGLGGVQMLAVSRPLRAAEGGEGDMAAVKPTIHESVVVPTQPTVPWQGTDLTQADFQNLVRDSDWDRLEALAVTEETRFPDAPEVTETLAWVRGMRTALAESEAAARIEAMKSLAVPGKGPLAAIAADEQSARLRVEQGSLIRPAEWQRLVREGDLGALLVSVRLARDHAEEAARKDLDATIDYVERLRAAVDKGSSEDPVEAIRDVYTVQEPESGPLRPSHEDTLAARSKEVVEQSLDRAWQAEQEDHRLAERLYGEIAEILADVSGATPSEVTTAALERANAGKQYVFALFKGESVLASAATVEAFESADSFFQRALERAGRDEDRQEFREQVARKQMGQLRSRLEGRILETWPKDDAGFANIDEEELKPVARLFGLYAKFIMQKDNLRPDEALEKAHALLDDLARR